MTPDQKRAEFEEFTRVKMQIHREMFGHADAMLAARHATGSWQPIRTTDSAPRFSPAEAHAAFQDAVLAAWNALKAPSVLKVTMADVQQMNEAAYDSDGNFQFVPKLSKGKFHV